MRENVVWNASEAKLKTKVQNVQNGRTRPDTQETPQNTHCVGEAYIVLALTKLDFSFKIVVFFS